MFDSRLQPLLRRALDPFAADLAARGVTADAMTLGGFAVGAAAAGALAVGAYRTALVLILVNRLADGLDGALARRLGPTDRGAFLDIGGTCKTFWNDGLCMADIVRSGCFCSVSDLVGDRLGGFFLESAFSSRALVMVLLPPDILGGDGRCLLCATLAAR